MRGGTTKPLLWQHLENLTRDIRSRVSLDRVERLARHRYHDAWKSNQVAHGMLESARRDLRDPDSVLPFRMLVDALEHVLAANDLPSPARFLELGCGVGHNGELLSRKFPGRFEYLGTDYSEELVKTARVEWPGRRFELDDVLNSAVDFDRFHVVCPSGLIECLADYRRGLEVILDCAAPYVILHRQTVVEHSSRVLVAKAYGRKCHNVLLNREELKRAALRHNRYVAHVVHEAGERHSTLVLPTNGYGQIVGSGSAP